MTTLLQELKKYKINSLSFQDNPGETNMCDVGIFSEDIPYDQWDDDNYDDEYDTFIQALLDAISDEWISKGNLVRPYAYCKGVFTVKGDELSFKGNFMEGDAN